MGWQMKTENASENVLLWADIQPKPQDQDQEPIVAQHSLPADVRARLRAEGLLRGGLE